MRNTLFIFACALLTGCTAAYESAQPSRSASDRPDVLQVAKIYRTLRSMTEKPVFVDPGLAARCSPATQAQVDAARKISGPHAQTAVSIFMNDLAADTFGKTKPIYPVGSIIVKEKKALGYSASDGVGGMIKRSPGYDSAHGDWEYFYFADANKVESGKMKSCIECHIGAAGKDYVFGGWAGRGYQMPQATQRFRRSAQ
jgi:hypothetical protein